MMKKFALILLALVLLTLTLGAGAEETGLTFTARLEARSRATGECLREAAEPTEALGEDEYWTIALRVRNGGTERECEALTALLDGTEVQAWEDVRLGQGEEWSGSLSREAMEEIAPGPHTVEVYLDGRKAGQARCVLPRDWSALMRLPEQEEIAAFRPRTRSPYIALYPSFFGVGRYSEYTVDFCGAYQPAGTYLCVGTWDMDKSDLRARYRGVHNEYESTAGYAGFQVLTNGTRCAILSFWDTYYTDGDGVEHTIRAARTWPERSLTGDDFGGEGTGAHCLVPYDWQPGRWYRALLRCSTSETTGNTLVSFWACDLETGEWTMLVEYDTGLRESGFVGDMRPFLENFETATAGRTRTMELANMRAYSLVSGQWRDIERAVFYQNFDYPGTYNYGSDGHSFWAITSGIPELAQLPPDGAFAHVRNALREDP